ncbi:MJ0042 family finger-like domain-containing protein [Neptunomonas qingdaonensis]|uniref:MJ0042 family finger-like domain-containing protein n=2 Tax=Neptunomonas qingdaonensis TaxID=1045558 RepID=A0A1I2S0K9_9GAMM|nr:DUF3426 domain-containing protein [Neptunomonas qingdaonensis]SFG46338.1 MJ0042 family finger-like domain-containing protein [Neptunomonas qingdaonensis]
MNGSSINTRCPACHTAFNVTNGQLKVADGLVRCGGCLHVFNAQESAESPLAGHANTPKYAATPTPTITEKHAAAPEAPAETLYQKQPIQQRAARQAQQPVQQSSSRLTQLTQQPTQPLTTQQAIKLPLLKHDFESPDETVAESSLSHFISHSLLICLVLLCITQILWFQKDEWIQQEQFRPVYKALYALMDQPLPARRSPDLIINKQLIIQPHKEFADAIRVSILLENTADFSQPFPTLQLIFSDLKGRTTAQRTLTASEYINTQLFPHQLMPSKQPIQIQLDMMAPGLRAVGYQLNLISS